jgi:hypothetical protein
VSPLAVCHLVKDLVSKVGSSFVLSNLLMALNWLWLYDNEHVLAGRWNLSEETIRNRVQKCCKDIQSLKETKIQWDDQGETIFVCSVYGLHCLIYKLRTDPESKWYSHKFNGPGVAYEIAVALHSNRVLSVRGPFPASTHAITIFCGG